MEKIRMVKVHKLDDKGLIDFVVGKEKLGKLQSELIDNELINCLVGTVNKMYKDLCSTLREELGSNNLLSLMYKNFTDGVVDVIEWDCEYKEGLIITMGDICIDEEGVYLILN